MPDPESNEIENLAYCVQALAESQAMSIEGTSFASQFSELKNEATVIRGWKEAVPDYIPQLEQTLDLFTSAKNAEQGNPSKTVQDPEVDQVQVPGVFRQVEARPVKAREQGKDVWYLVQILREGFFQKLDWASAQLVEGWLADGNSSKISHPAGGAALENTTSDNPEEVILIRFPNVDPEKLAAVAGSVKTSYTKPEVQGHTFTGDWDKVIVHPRQTEDGSGVVDVMLSRQKYALNLFSHNNSSIEQRIGKLWGVPKKLAQSIITAWDAGSGRSANGTLRAGERLVDITLTASTGVSNLTTSWVQIACDTWERHHFAWGYTEAQIDTFIKAHDSAIGTTEDARMINSRRFDRLNTRGTDGLFDMIITEKSYGPHANPETPDVTITLPIGTKITKLESWGYNLRTSEITSAAFKAVYNETVKKVGRTVEVKITREDDCSFDYHATINEQSKAIESKATVLQTGGLGVVNVAKSVHGATAAELIVAMASEKATYKQDVQVKVVSLDNELADLEISKRTGVETDLIGKGGSGIKGGARGAHTQLRVLNNAAPTTLDSDAYPTARGASVTYDIKVNDAGGLSVAKLANQQVEQSLGTDLTHLVTSGDAAHKLQHVAKVGDVDATDADLDQWLATAGKKVSLRPTVDKTGAKSYELIVSTAQNLNAITGVIDALTLSNLDARFNRGGYADVAYPFRACVLASIPARAGYYYFQQITYNTDDTFDGILVIRSYNNAYTGLIGVAGTSQAAVGEVQLLRYGKSVYAIRPQYTITWDMDVLQSGLDTGGTVTTRVRIGKASLYGQEVWTSEMWDLTGWEYLSATNTWTALGFGDSLTAMCTLT